MSTADDTDYWNQWSSTAIERYESLRPFVSWSPIVGQTTGGITTLGWDGRFTADAPVPRWLREATSGLLQRPDSSTLQLARIYDAIDWPALLAAHPGEVEVDLSYAPVTSWAGVCAAWTVLTAEGYVPALDVQLGVDSAANLAIAPTTLYCTVADAQVRDHVTTALGVGYGSDPDLAGWWWS